MGIARSLRFSMPGINAIRPGLPQLSPFFLPAVLQARWRLSENRGNESIPCINPWDKPRETRIGRDPQGFTTTTTFLLKEIYLGMSASLAERTEPLADSQPSGRPDNSRPETKRFLRAVRGEAVDRPPFWLMRQAGRYLPEYRAVREQAGSFLDLCYNPEFATEVTLQPIRRFGMDAAILFADILLIPQALGQPLDFKVGEGPVLEPVRTREAIPVLDNDRLHGTLVPVYETVARLSRALPDEVALIGFAGAPWTVATYMVEGGSSRDFATVRRWAMRDPDGFAPLIDVLVESTVAYLAAQVRAGAETVQLFDTWAGTLSEGEFRRWVIAPTRRIVERLKAEFPGLPVIGFPRGAGARYPEFIRETGVDAVSLDSGVPLQWAHDELQPLATVQGNLDPHCLVVGGEVMEAEIARILATLGGGPFIFNLGHGIVPETPPEHVGRLAEIIRGSGQGG
jgi:uroporphyrinogen decarboxylase